ncbi:MAG: hypothetical protein ABI565_14530 [Vicinamibacteria bacterium]
MSIVWADATAAQNHSALPRGSHHATLTKVRLAVAFLGANPNQTDPQAVANHTATLPIGATS